MRELVQTAAIVLGLCSQASADQAVVVARFNGCDYFIADGRRGLYVLEWYGGHDPDEGERVVGEIAGYGMTQVYYPDADREGKVWVEDFLESESAALDDALPPENWIV